jgi:hypothetical protein
MITSVTCKKAFPADDFLCKQQPDSNARLADV